MTLWCIDKSLLYLLTMRVFRSDAAVECFCLFKYEMVFLAVTCKQVVVWAEGYVVNIFNRCKMNGKRKSVSFVECGKALRF